MAEKKVSFEENMTKLEQIVNELQSGDVPLEKALTEFQTGVKLSQEMQKTLENAENTLTKMVNPDGEEVPFKRDRGYETQEPAKANESGDLPF
ncbi:exodeoxyribonuclease VII small subunit [Fructilactobacillus sanfranciscensis]|uniref:Exodeoxyribonuclease 7 small subunit n=1 Tax=Fructilactobacillus sanfranciscensis TaxID=1625 RepID=A0A5C4TKK9_FRUSA|nr:exodeoxyribonuclease VII small subunit [Fructilactobacillus sanfranciscensis]NDR76595.1 exodeoxyribonuclease VII small subunit [Fructilactobacillus sanfranciscensis]TNK91031.1 exodeoxyribonuclease VII small subunit [Fructilactobacillus sanfranciscensis]